MALTKVSGPLLHGSNDNLGNYVINNITGAAATFTGNVSVGGTLTYDDVTNVNSVGIITAKGGLHVGAGGTIIHALSEDNGKVGIGTDNPQEILHAHQDTGTATVLISSPTAPQIRINPSAADGSDNDRTIFGQATANSHFVSTAVADDTVLRGTSTGNLIFGIATSEKLRIESGGNVIIGSGGAWSYPKPLNVQGSSGSIISLYNGDTTTYAADTNSSIELKLLTGNTNNTTGALEIRGIKEEGTNGNNARALTFYTGVNGGSNQERLRIESDGSVGIGTDSAVSDTKLDVLGNVVFGPRQQTGNPGANTGIASIRGHLANTVGDFAQLYFSNSESTGGGTGAKALISGTRDGVAGSNYGAGLSFNTEYRDPSVYPPKQRMLISSLGIIGINTSAPTAYFDIATNAGTYDNLRLRRIDSGSSGNSDWSLKPYGGNLYFRTAGANDKIVFTDGGKVGINTAATSHTLMLYGATSSSFRIATTGVLAYDHTFDGSTYTIANNNGSGGVPLDIGTKQSGGLSLRIDASGNIVPGTDNNQNVGSGSTNFNSIWASTRFRGNDNVKLVLGNSQNLVIRHDGNENIIGSPVADNLFIKSGTGDVDSNYLASFIHTNQRVGIGISAPNARLHIASGTSSAVGDDTNPAFQIGNTTNFRFAIHTTSEGAIIGNKNGDDGILFKTKLGNNGVDYGNAMRLHSRGYRESAGYHYGPWTFTNNTLKSTITIGDPGDGDYTIVKFILTIMDSSYRQNLFAGEYAVFASNANGGPGVVYQIAKIWDKIGSGNWSGGSVTVSVSSGGAVQILTNNDHNDTGGDAYVHILDVIGDRNGSTIATITS